VVEYTDGDKEDFNEKELEYGYELDLQIALDEEDNNEETSDVFTSDGEEESYRPLRFAFLSLVSPLV
jgi:hypothetical protein